MGKEKHSLNLELPKTLAALGLDSELFEEENFERRMELGDSVSILINKETTATGLAGKNLQWIKIKIFIHDKEAGEFEVIKREGENVYSLHHRIIETPYRGKQTSDGLPISVYMLDWMEECISMDSASDTKLLIAVNQENVRKWALRNGFEPVEPEDHMRMIQLSHAPSFFRANKRGFTHIKLTGAYATVTLQKEVLSKKKVLAEKSDTHSSINDAIL